MIGRPLGVGGDEQAFGCRYSGPVSLEPPCSHRSHYCSHYCID